MDRESDRHHENWGILRERIATGWLDCLAPTFDHASSLGRELVDDSAGKSRRRLLLHRREIQKLFELTHIKGNALVGLRLYWKEHRVKLELGVGSGKTKADQRLGLKERAVKREVEREVSLFNRKRGV